MRNKNATQGRASWRLPVDPLEESRGLYVVWEGEASLGHFGGSIDRGGHGAPYQAAADADPLGAQIAHLIETRIHAGGSL